VDAIQIIDVPVHVRQAGALKPSLVSSAR
jgi:hypothetical protein